MGDVKWIKLDTGIFSDQKIIYIRSLPKGNDMVLVWIAVLCIAAECNLGGRLGLTDRLAHTEATIAQAVRMDEQTVKTAMATFMLLGMVHRDGAWFIVTHWEDHQNLEWLERRRAADRERKRKKSGKDAECPRNFRGSSAGIPQTDIDKDKEEEIEKEKSKEKKPPGAENFIQEFADLWSRYPVKKGKAMAYKAYVEARQNGVSFEEVQEGLQKFNDELLRTGTEPEYIPYGGNWFRDRRWEDDYTSTQGEGAGYGSAQEFFELAVQSGMAKT